MPLKRQFCQLDYLLAHYNDDWLFGLFYMKQDLIEPEDILMDSIIS